MTDLKASVVERVNRTLKFKLYWYFTAVNSLHYMDVLQDLADSYNNTCHKSIGRAPATVSLLNVGTVRKKLYDSTATKKFKFHVGDHNLQLKTFHGIGSLYACASNVIFATGFVHSFRSQNKFRQKSLYLKITIITLAYHHNFASA